MKVIIADDSDLILDRLKQVLGQYEDVQIVGSYKNGTEALGALRFLKPDLAILDIKMPGLSGLQILTEIQKENHSLVTIIFTFHETVYYRQMAMKAGADYFLSKVDDFEKIPKIIDGLLSGRKS